MFIFSMESKIYSSLVLDDNELEKSDSLNHVHCISYLFEVEDDVLLSRFNQKNIFVSTLQG